MNTKIKHYNKWLKHSLFRIQLNITVCTLENQNWSIYSSGRNLLCLETDFNNVSCYSSSAYPIRKLVGCPPINKGHCYRRSNLAMFHHFQLNIRAVFKNEFFISVISQLFTISFCLQVIGKDFQIFWHSTTCSSQQRVFN